MNKLVHIIDRRSRDPEGRDEAIALCGADEECSSTGKHGMAHLRTGATCPAYIAAWDLGMKDGPGLG